MSQEMGTRQWIVSTDRAVDFECGAGWTVVTEGAGCRLRNV